MTYLLITLVVFIAFVVFQTLYTIIPLFKNEGKNQEIVSKKYSFSVLVPMYNEEKVIRHCLSGFQQLSYEHAECIFVNDGSNDDTMKLLKTLLNLKAIPDYPIDKTLPHQLIKQIYHSVDYPHITVIDKLNGGKADALNAGINCSSNELIITLDADSVLDANALSEMNKAFQQKDVIACGGNVLIAQAFQGEMNHLQPTFKMKGIIRYQFLQYLSAFYLHKRAQSTLRAITVIAGAFGAFRKEILLSIDGFRVTIGEDMDITLKLHKWIKENGDNEKITFIPTAKCYTECPSTFNNLFKQRVRWQKAFIDCLIHYRKCYFRKFSTRFSLLFLVDQFIIGTLNAFPVILTPLLLLFYSGHLVLLLLFGTGAILLFMYQSITALYVGHVHGIRFSKMDLGRVFLFLPIEIFVFRMINLSFVVFGTLTYFYQPQTWNKVERSGAIGEMKVSST